MRWLTVLALVGAFTLAGCGQAPADTTAVGLGDISYYEVHTPDGSVPCLVYSGINKGGLSCDWDAIR